MTKRNPHKSFCDHAWAVVSPFQGQIVISTSGLVARTPDNDNGWSVISDCPANDGGLQLQAKILVTILFSFFDGVLDKEPILSRASKFPRLILFLCWYPKLCRPLLTDIFPTKKKKWSNSLSVFMWPRVEIWRAALFESGQGPKGISELIQWP